MGKAKREKKNYGEKPTQVVSITIKPQTSNIKKLLFYFSALLGDKRIVSIILNTLYKVQLHFLEIIT